MDEAPKNLWKKTFTGRTALVVCLAVAVFTVMLGSFIIALADVSRPLADTFMAVALFAGAFLAVCLLLIYIVWPLTRWLFWKHWRRTLFGLACFATLVALGYAEEDWRGKHDWEKFKREWEAKGEHFDFASVIPPPVPDDQNFAMQPIWVDSIKYEYGSNVCKQWYGVDLPESTRTNLIDRLSLSLYADKYSDGPPHSGNWTTGTKSDLTAWQNYYRSLAAKTNLFPVSSQSQTPAKDVLLALSKYDSAIEELRRVSRLPYSRFPLNYDGIPAAILLPHLAAEKRCGQVLQLRTIAELQNGESKEALEDVKLMLQLTDASRTEPFLISHLVRIAVLKISLQPVWEGLAEHKWSDAQLADLDAELTKLDFLGDYEFGLSGELASCIGNIEFFQHPHDFPFQHPWLYKLAPTLSLMEIFSALSGAGEVSKKNNFSLVALGVGPSGWLDQNKLRIARFETTWYLPIVDQNKKTISPAKACVAETAFREEIRHRTPENVLETLLLPALGRWATKCAYAQASVDLARTAIALERFRLAHGEFPESLDALAPQFMEKIPHDIINGGPLHYRRTGDGQFVLYSVGWNEKDEGGVVAFTKGTSPSVEISQGDWVWRYPPK